MATIKSSFAVRKSRRLSEKQIQEKLLPESDIVPLNKSALKYKNLIDSGSPNKVMSNALDCSLSLSKYQFSKSCSSSDTWLQNSSSRVLTSKSLTRISSAHLLIKEINTDQTKICSYTSPTKSKSSNNKEQCIGSFSPVRSSTIPDYVTFVKSSPNSLLSPTKRKSDEESESSDFHSPAKAKVSADRIISTVKSNLSFKLSPTKRKSENEENCSSLFSAKTRLPSGNVTPRKSFQLSPTKRKPDNENELFCISPVAAKALSDSDSAPCLSAPCHISSHRNHCSPASETPKSSRRLNKTVSAVGTSTPRRLFGSPSKQNSISELETPLKDNFDDCNRSYNSSTPQRPRSAAKPYQSAKRCLHTAKPERLIARDSEFAEIEEFICDKLKNDSSGSLYISGAPGTGKTVVVNHVISKLQNEYDDLKTVFINCMTLKDSNAVLQQIHEQLTGSHVKGKDAIRALETIFTTCKKYILLVLDEIDQLDSKFHHILYRIFEWPALKNSKVILIGIANALDLTDRVLPRLQASQTCKPTLMNFRPYTSVQITEILKHRLERDSIVEPSAVNFCARKVSAVAGDARKALDICRRAVEMVESESRCELVLKPTDCNSPTKQKTSSALKKVTITHISKVMSDVYGSSVSAANSSENDVPLQQKLAVCSLLVLVKSGKLKEVQLGKLHEAYTIVCRHQHLEPVDQSEFTSILHLLDSRGIVMLKKAKDTRLTKVSLKLDEQELEQTLKDKVLMATILKEGIPK